jgi:hypothetical protein
MDKLVHDFSCPLKIVKNISILNQKTKSFLYRLIHI